MWRHPPRPWEAVGGLPQSRPVVRLRLLPNPQFIQLGLEGAPIDYLRGSKFISHEVCHLSLRWRLGRCPHFLRSHLSFLTYGSSSYSLPRGGEIAVRQDLLPVCSAHPEEALAQPPGKKPRYHFWSRKRRVSGVVLSFTSSAQLGSRTQRLHAGSHVANL